MSNTRKITKKITVKSIAGDMNKDMVANGPVNIMSVLAKVTSFKTANTNFGEYLDFRGQFEATNLLTGEITHGARMIVPPIVEGVLAAALEGMQEGDNAFAAFVIGLQPSDRGERGYEYTLEVLNTAAETEVSDPFASIRELAASSLPRPLALEDKSVKK